MKIKTLIVDDTVTYRSLITKIVETMPELEVVGSASNGKLALQRMALTKIDLVFLDVNMPEMDGIETLKHIKIDYPDTEVVMISSLSEDSVRTTLSALNKGALEFISKPTGSDLGQNRIELTADIKRVVNLFSNFKFKTKGKTNIPIPVVAPPLHKRASTAIVPRHFEIVVIGVSTGGPNALHKLIPLLPANLKVPILLVQHMPPKFTEALASALDKKSNLKVVEAEAATALKSGTVTIAKGGTHLVVHSKNGQFVLGESDGPPENSCKPSVDVLFRSVANYFGTKGVLAVILTGMGSDGLNGVKTLKRKSCLCLSQSKETCVVYGMPRAIDEAGLSDESLSLEGIAAKIIEKVGA